MRRGLAAFLWCLASVLGAAPLELDKPRQNVLEHAHLWVDQSKSLDFDTLRRLPSETAFTLKGGAAGFGFSRNAHWFRFELHNAQPQPLKRLLVLEPTWLDRIEGRIIGPAGSITAFEGGDRMMFAQRAFWHPKNVYELTLEPGLSTVLVRVETRDPFVVTMTLWEERAFFGADSNYRLYLGFIYGALIAMIVYNLFLCATIRDRIYGYYALYVGTFVAMNFTYSGLSFAHLWPALPEWGNWAHSVLIFVFTFAGLLFAAVFLDTKNRLPKLHKLLLGYGAFIVAVSVVTAWVGYSCHVAAAVLLVIPYSVFVFSLGLYAWIKGNRSARFFVLGTTAGLAGAAITSMTVSSLLPFHFLTYRAADIGMVLDALFLSMALADRYKGFKKESELLRIKDAQREAIMLKQHQQAVLGGLIGAIAHQMKQPLSVISVASQSLCEGVRANDLTPKELEESETAIQKSVIFMDQTIDQFKNYFRPDKTKKRFNLSNLLHETLGLLGDQLRAHRIGISVECAAGLTLKSHENELQQVILNLVSNAVDVLCERAVAAPKITVEAAQKEGKVQISISDNGGGIGPEALGRLFELFFTTKGDKGTGIGLHLSKMLVTESLGGEIRAENSGAGARFTITL